MMIELYVDLGLLLLNNNFKSYDKQKIRIKEYTILSSNLINLIKRRNFS